MALRVTHELHDRRRSRNRGLGIVLAAFIVIVFGLTVVKVRTLGADQVFDNTMKRPDSSGQTR